jgi:hypothetical protein
MAPNVTARSVMSRSADGQTIEALLPPSSRIARTEIERAAIWHAIQTANDATMRYVVREVGWTRSGKGGTGVDFFMPMQGSSASQGNGGPLSSCLVRVDAEADRTIVRLAADTTRLFALPIYVC